ncbi:MAG: Uma2 family endonuclease [Synechococcales cyanobacterium RU_4_20]|nr:Uma2 family endonuclease [Synechococcales cyanobacterium RU_4_20]NJR68129.1 Uma2 family endonuclease [Synechococcales cyanobacterium CRU_2_2]
MQQLTQASQPNPADSTPVQRAPMCDLPSEFPREPGLPDVYHDLQPALLSATLRLSQYATQERFSGSDLNLYYDKAHRLWHKRPDWFLAVDVPLLYDGTDLRDSYVAWDPKETAPSVIIELLSPGTAKQDLGPFYGNDDEPDPAVVPVPEIDHYLVALETDNGGDPKPVKPPVKWTVYEAILQVPYYIVFDRRTLKLWFFRWINGKYERQSLNAENPRLWIDRLGIGLGLWEGTYCDVQRTWLRWCDAEGHWLPTPEEAERAAKLQERSEKRQALEQLDIAREQAAQAQQQAAQAQQQAAQAQQQAAQERRLREALLDRLKQQGIDVNLDDL